MFGASGSRYRSYLAFGFFLQPSLHKQAGPLSEPCRCDAARRATQNTFLFCLTFPLRRRVAAEQTRLLTLMACFVLHTVCTRTSRYSPAPTAGMSELAARLVEKGRQWGVMRHIQRQQMTEALREQHTIHVQARHSMQRYVPVGCVPCKQHHRTRLGALRSSRTVPL